MSIAGVWEQDDADAGVPANSPPPFQVPGYVNDVFGTVANVANEYFKTRNAATSLKTQNSFELAKLAEQTKQTQIIAQAAPGALAGGWLQNLLPNQWNSTNPRLETLPQYATSSINPVTLIILAIVAVVLIAFARK